MRVLLLGSSGFIGREIAKVTPENTHLTGTYNSNKPDNPQYELMNLNLLSEGIDWNETISSYDCIIVAARANSADPKSRTELSIRASKSFANLIEAITKHSDQKYLLVVNGSLSYGERGDDLVDPDDNINPIGFAKSYSVAEKPFIEYHRKGGRIGIIRAPWVIGNGSWFTQMYLQPQKIPLIHKGKQWMSIVTVEELAKYVWGAVVEEKIGVFHPKLTYRCRQEEFAKIVAEVTNKPVKKHGRLKMVGWDGQMRESILASIRLDDGFDNESENLEARQNLLSYLLEI